MTPAFPKPTPKAKRKPRGLPRKRAKPRRGPWRSEAYRAEVRELPCCAWPYCGPCRWEAGRGLVEASHADVYAEKGGGMKAGDQRCVPHCPGHHDDWEQRKGAFAGWSKEGRQVWADAWTRDTQRTLGYPERWRQAPVNRNQGGSDAV